MDLFDRKIIGWALINSWDNACAESFFKTIKVELETLDGKHSADKVRQSAFFYIEAYYNKIKITLGN
jgi:transposase InsO family protein